MNPALRVVLVFVGVAASSAWAAVPADVIDFSSAGYSGGGVPRPAVPARYAVSPTGQDDTAAIQAAINAVAALPVGADGFRGAVLLRAGSYRVAGQLKIHASGVVLRGQNATLLATGESRRTLIEVAGRDDRTITSTGKITDVRVGPGERTLKVEPPRGLEPGQRVLVRRPSTREWIAALGMTNFPGPGQYKDARLDWVPGSRDIEWERTIAAADPTAGTVTVDAPLTTAIERQYGGAVVETFTWPGRLENVGVENLDCVSETSADNPVDEEHAWSCVSIDAAENAWVRNVSARRFVCAAVWVGNRARAITVEDCRFLEPVAESAGWRRVGFYVGGQQVLVQRCTSDGGRHDFAAGHCSAGPNVFLECRATNAQVDAGPFESWANGVLYDRVTVAGAGLSLANVGVRTQGAGWTAANCVVWNGETSSKIWSDDPPGAANKVFADVETPSLYRAQLRARRGSEGPMGPTRVASDEGVVPPPPPPAPTAARRPHRLSLAHGHLLVDGRVLLGGSMNSSLWKGQLIPGREREAGTSPTRWAPGRVGPGLTEDLSKLAQAMAAQRTAIYWAFPGLWYDRRRDDHSIAIRDDAEVWGPFFEPPWRLSGKGRNAMGLSKYDLTKPNPWFFSRLKEFADECASNGVVLACQVYDNHNVEEAAAHWADFAWRPLNTIQDIGFPEPPHWENAGQNRHHIADEFYDPEHPLRRRLHEQYIRHTLDVLGDSSNVIFTLGYQFAGPLRFQQFFLDVIAAWEKEHGRRVHVALQTSKAVTDAILADPARAGLVDVIDLRYWQYLPDGKLFAPDGQGKSAFRELRTEAFGRDSIMRSTPELVYRQVREYRDRFPDKAIICGHAGFGPIPVVMAGGAEAVVAESTLPREGAPRDDAAFYRFVADNLAETLPRMKPINGWSDDAWCLGEKDRPALVYTLKGETIALKEPLGEVHGSWFNPENGEATEARIDPTARAITKPTSGAWLLWLK